MQHDNRNVKFLSPPLMDTVYTICLILQRHKQLYSHILHICDHPIDAQFVKIPDGRFDA